MHLFPDSAIKIANIQAAKLLKTANAPLRPMPDIIWFVQHLNKQRGAILRGL
ncbi:MAG: hypothetical protein ACJAT7_000576 [Psychromonas sp.]|jgi:hypothetical protein